MRDDQPNVPMLSRLSTFQVAVYFFMFIGGAAALLATEKPLIIVSAWSLCAAVLAGLALFTLGKKDHKSAALCASGAVLLAGALVAYLAIVSPFTPPVVAHNEQGQTAQPQPTSPGAAPKPSDKPQTSSIWAEGTVEIWNSQAVDIDVPNAKASLAAKVAPPHDVFISVYAMPSDRDGYLLTSTEDAMKGPEVCKRVFEMGRPRQDIVVLPFVWYCVRTSEGRVAAIKVVSGELRVYGTSTVQLAYRVWK